MGRIQTDEAMADFRARLCRAAEALLAEGGPSAVSMRKVAAKLGVSPMTPYRYFESKKAMIDAVQVRAFERLAKALEDARCAAGTCEVGWAVSEAYFAFASEHPAVYRLMFDFGPAGKGADPALAKVVGRTRAAMSRDVECSLEGPRRTSDAQLVGDLFWATLHGLLALRMAGKLRDFEKLRAVAATAISRGLANRSFL